MVPEDTSRHDAVVVLTRGQGTRMGREKAGLKLPGDDRTFLARILDLYGSSGWPMTAVTFPGGIPACRTAAQGRVVSVIEGSSHGDTALTLLTAWRLPMVGGEEPTHWWAHPVDLPLVESMTLQAVLSASRAYPGRVVRPAYGKKIGHPVVLPAGVLAELESKSDWHDGALRHFLDHRITSDPGSHVWTESVPDEGVVHDFDQPEDLAAWRPKTGDHDEQP